jgi:signal transduction histidine kinase
VMYTYRLNGSSDTTWSKPENIHEASYINLAPGNYIFEVKTLGWNGKYGEPATFEFSIATPFWKQWWFITVCGLLIAAAIYAVYRYRIKQIMHVQKMRNTIATDLHDDIGSSLTNISILAELSHKNIQHPGEAKKFLQRINEEVQYSGQAMDDIIWSVNTQNDTLEDTLARMRRYTAELLDGSGTRYHLNFDENIRDRKLNMEQRRDVYLMYKEMLNNIYKHANAQEVWINVHVLNNELDLKVRDNGKGFKANNLSHRNGLKNLYHRTHKWRGKIRIESNNQQGTTIDISVPLSE